MSDTIKIVLIGVALFAYSCYLFYKFREMDEKEESVKSFAEVELKGTDEN